MQAGRLRHQITLQQPTKGRDARGGITETWVTFKANVWAGVEPIKGREYFESQQVNAEVSHRIVLRYLQGVNPRMRVLWGTRIFRIESVIDPEERHRELQLMCIEVV